MQSYGLAVADWWMTPTGVTRSARISWPHSAPSSDLWAASQVAAGAAMQRRGDPARWRPILWVSYKVARGGAGDRRDWSAAIALASLCASERSKRWRGPSRPSRRRSVLWSPTQWPVTGRRAGRCDRRSRRRFRGAAPADRRLCDGPNFHPADAIAIVRNAGSRRRVGRGAQTAAARRNARRC
jgi:hypothetical protein